MGGLAPPEEEASDRHSSGQKIVQSGFPGLARPSLAQPYPRDSLWAGPKLTFEETEGICQEKYLFCRVIRNALGCCVFTLHFNWHSWIQTSKLDSEACSSCFLHKRILVS